jgi:CubicO group peptidase (beta-lactamase class C family)
VVRRVYAFLGVLLLVGCTVRSPELPMLSAKGTAAMDAVLQTAVAKGEIPGVVAAVVNKDRILFLKAFGKQDVAKNIPMFTNTVFRIASMTKPVTSVGIMMLQEQGRLHLDDPAANYLPQLKGREVLANVNADGTYTTRPAKIRDNGKSLAVSPLPLSQTVSAMRTRPAYPRGELGLL